MGHFFAKNIISVRDLREQLITNYSKMQFLVRSSQTGRNKHVQSFSSKKHVKTCVPKSWVFYRGKLTDLCIKRDICNSYLVEINY